jgi:predicted DsbA family dithiol-disulfide isomerase
MTMQDAGTFKLQIVSDVICPWCFIGKRSLDRALPRLAEQGVDIEVEWLPYQLNPQLPLEGADRKAFRSVRFGSWANAQAMDARAVEAGRGVGAVFDYERQGRTPSTLVAHGLSRLAWQEGGSPLQHRLVDALFVAYFSNGEDIGDHAVLDRIALEVGMPAQAVSRSIPLQAEVRRLEQMARATGLNAVPSYLVDGELLFTGSQDAEGYLRKLAAAARRAV